MAGRRPHRAQHAEPRVAIVDGSAIYDHWGLRLSAGPTTAGTTHPPTADTAHDEHADHVGGVIAATFEIRKGL